MGRGKSVMLVSKILFWVSDLIELLVSVLWLEVGTLLSSCLWGVVWYCNLFPHLASGANNFLSTPPMPSPEPRSSRHVYKWTKGDVSKGEGKIKGQGMKGTGIKSKKIEKGSSCSLQGKVSSCPYSWKAVSIAVTSMDWEACCLVYSLTMPLGTMWPWRSYITFCISVLSPLSRSIININLSLFFMKTKWDKTH